MTTWTGNNANARRTNYIGGNIIQKTYSITGVSGDTGGTLTCQGLKLLKNYVVNVYKTAAGVASTGRITGNTVLVAYADPGAGHTVKVTVWGLKN